jgi:hypothetical protein
MMRLCWIIKKTLEIRGSPSLGAGPDQSLKTRNTSKQSKKDLDLLIMSRNKLSISMLSTQNQTQIYSRQTRLAPTRSTSLHSQRRRKTSLEFNPLALVDQLQGLRLTRARRREEKDHRIIRRLMFG